MTKTRELTMFEKGEVIGLHKGKHNPTEISRILKIPRTTCVSIIKKFEKDKTVIPNPCSRRLPLLKAIDKRHFIRTAVANRKDSADEITEKFNNLGLTEPSTITARRVLHEHGYYGHVGQRKPLVSESNRKKRFKWRQERLRWDKESRFLLFESDGKHYVWHKPHEKYDIDCIRGISDCKRQ